MAFTFKVLAWGFAFLLAEFLLLLFDPSEFGDRKDSDGVEIHPQRGRDPNSSGRRVDTQVDVLDVLFHDLYRDAAEIDLCGRHQYSFCCLMIRKIRSTS